MIFKSFCPTILISVEAHTQAVLFLIIICQKKKQLYIKTKTTENYVLTEYITLINRNIQKTLYKNN